MMKLLFPCLLMLAPLPILANERLERTVSEMEAKSSTLAIDANSYRNTIVEKYQSLAKQKGGTVSTDAYFSLENTLENRANELISTAQSLSSAVIQIMQSGRSDLDFFSHPPEEPSLADRVFVVVRELECTEFSVKIIQSATVDPRALALANDVARRCADINKAQLSANNTVEATKKASMHKRSK